MLKQNKRDNLAEEIRTLVGNARHGEYLASQTSFRELRERIEKVDTGENSRMSVFLGEVKTVLTRAFDDKAKGSKTFLNKMKNILERVATNSQVVSTDVLQRIKEEMRTLKKDKHITDDFYNALNAIIIEFENAKNERFENAVHEIEEYAESDMYKIHENPVERISSITDKVKVREKESSKLFFSKILKKCEEKKHQTSSTILLGVIKREMNSIKSKQRLSSQEIFNAMKDIIKEVKKIIIVLDCCYAETPCVCEQAFKNLKLQNKTVIQLNGGTNRQETIADLKHGSIFVQTFV